MQLLAVINDMFRRQVTLAPSSPWVRSASWRPLTSLIEATTTQTSRTPPPFVTIALFTLQLFRPQMLGVLVGVEQKDKFIVFFRPRSPSTLAVACALLVLLVRMLLALCSLLLSSGPRCPHLGRYGPEGRFSATQWPRSSSTTVVWLVFLVPMHLALCRLFPLCSFDCRQAWGFLLMSTLDVFTHFCVM